MKKIKEFTISVLASVSAAAVSENQLLHPQPELLKSLVIILILIILAICLPSKEEKED